VSKADRYVTAVKEAVKLEQKHMVNGQTMAYITEDSTLVIRGGPIPFKDAIPLARWILEVFGTEG
jgi:hypothetical protein